jgi:hydroxyacylglutathione hydrolase
VITRGISWLGTNFLPRNSTEFEKVEPGILIDEEMDLLEFGISGRVIHTPGHTGGFISLRTNSGEAFVGDLAVNYLPFNISVFADDRFCEKP